MKDQIPFFEYDREKIVKKLGRDTALHLLKEMLRIRNFEIRAEAGYQQGKIGGFLHLYIGEEAIQTAATHVMGPNNWYSTSYRCHAMALLLGESASSLMAELYGKATGNALGRGGSMHMYSKRMLGGFGIVGGQIPVATGAALTCKYLEKKDEISVCFFGDGAVPQGVFHESLNLASLWSLPCMYVIENNNWSMGTPLHRTIANHKQFSNLFAKAYGVRHYLLDGMDIFQCIAGFEDAYTYVKKEGRPVVIECRTDRFRGHSISDPGLYRTKEELSACVEKDPILLLKNELLARSFLSESDYKELEQQCREEMITAVKEADEAPFPDPQTAEFEPLAPRCV
jgi:pyruvate dehydrogenase E1 component alpha subunit